MSGEEIEIVRGSGNIYRDFGDPDADAKQMKAQLASEIIAILNRRKLTVRKAAEVTGVTAADISRIRNAALSRFTIDRLVRILNRLDRRVELRVRKAPKSKAA